MTRCDDSLSVVKSIRPKAFLSHSSLDKERFVRQLDTLLRDRGIEVWLDERDLLPGTNLVDEIFTHGITAADVFIVVLSKNSIQSRWVHEELSVAIVQKIAGVVKSVVPIVIDNVTPPDALLATVWERIPDVTRLDIHADRIAAAVLGVAPAPVAPAAAYAGIPVHRIGNLTADDERVFSAFCASLVENGHRLPYVQIGLFADAMRKLGMPEGTYWESIAALEQAYYLTDTRQYDDAGRPQLAKIAMTAFDAYLVAYRPTEYRAEKIAVLSALVNSGARDSRDIAQNLGIHEYIVEHILAELEIRRHVRIAHGETMTVMPEPTLKRVLQALSDEG